MPNGVRSLLISVGDVYSLILGTKTLIVLSSDQAVKELLDRRSGTYSSRPELYIGQDLCSDGLRLLMMVRYLLYLLSYLLMMKKPYGPQWRMVSYPGLFRYRDADLRSDP